jgi:hypothetical protein
MRPQLKASVAEKTAAGQRLREAYTVQPQGAIDESNKTCRLSVI